MFWEYAAWIGAGLIVIIGYWLFLRRERAAWTHLCRDGRTVRQIQELAGSADEGADLEALRTDCRTLAAHLLRLERALKAAPPLPAGDDEPRIMALARELADGESLSAETLVTWLREWEVGAPAPSEAASLPLSIAVAERQRLGKVLRILHEDLRQRQAAQRLAIRLKRRRDPQKALLKNTLNTVGLAALLREVSEDRQIRSLVDAWLEERRLTAEGIAMAGVERQMRIAEELRRARACFDTLEKLNWVEASALADPLHETLLSDPAKVYPAMSAASQLQLRMQIEAFCRRTQQDREAAAQKALALSREEEKGTDEGYVGWYFSDAQGMLALHRSLHARHGRLYARWARRRDALTRAGFWTFGFFSGFGFLQSGQPVLMLPFFLLTTGAIVRHFAGQIKPAELPSMADSPAGSHARTLVVFHREVHDVHEAIRAVRQVKTALPALRKENCDVLLFLDPSPAITAGSSSDLPIIQAAAAALAALEDGRIMYLHRGRSWNADGHHYSARAGRQGALEDVCRLIAQGECEDVIGFATAEPASLERKYAYVMWMGAKPTAPDLLPRLLRTVAHPMNGRFAILSPEGRPSFDGTGLVRPDAYLEATDGLLPPHANHEALGGELAGWSVVPGAWVAKRPEGNTWEDMHERSKQAWRMLPWQLPYVKTISGLVRNPLGSKGRFRLREMLRSALVPFGQAVLLMYAVLVQELPLFLIALLTPAVGMSLNAAGMKRFLRDLSLLPTRAAVALLGCSVLVKRAKPKWEWTVIEVWIQGLSATLMIALAFVLPGFFVPSLFLGTAFALFPLAHRDSAPAQEEPLSSELIGMLEGAAKSSWRYFTAHVTEATHFLPTGSVQTEPPLPTNDTSPQAIGGYLLACVCVKDTGVISANDAALRLRQAAEGIRQLSMPFGLPCRRYALSDLSVLDASVDGRAVGFLMAALMAAAQALRSWLPELSQEYITVPAELTAVLDSFDLSRLYDEKATLFHAGLDADGQGKGYLTRYADPGLVLSLVACAREDVPPEHLTRLERLQTALPQGKISVSDDGSASSHLLAGLFLPIDGEEAASYIRAMIARAQKGLWGQDTCRYFAFDAALRFREGHFGVPALSLRAPLTEVAFAPHAAALALPFAPQTAAQALARYRDLGILTQEGYCDAIDLSRSEAPVRVLDACHQGLTLAAIAHALADAPIRRYFCGLPEVEGLLPLLESRERPLLLPKMPVRRKADNAPEGFSRTVRPLLYPPETHMLGTADFRLTADAWGNLSIRDGDVPLLPEGVAPGLQFLVYHEGEAYRLGHPLLPGDVFFGPGEIRYDQRCGSLRTELVCTVDTLRRRVLHILTITNLSTLDRLIEVADRLLPDLGASCDTLAYDEREGDLLTAQARSTGMTLYHSVRCSVPPLRLTRETSEGLSFHVKVSLNGRGQVLIWFSTSLMETAVPGMAELAGLRQLAALQHGALAAASPLKQGEELLMSRLTGLLRASDWKLCLLQEDAHTEALLQLAAMVQRLALHGTEAAFGVQCAEGWSPAVQEALTGHPMEETIRIYGEDAPEGLTLVSSRPLDEQIDRLYASLPEPKTNERPPVPALLPRREVVLGGEFGGFEAETSDYLIQLEPQQALPSPWENRHVSRYFAEIVRADGFSLPFEEQVRIELPDGTVFSPWSKELPRCIRMGRGLTEWETWTDRLDVKLSAACMPGHRCGLRVLRIRNASEEHLRLTVTIAANLARNTDLAPGLVIAEQAGPRAFLAGDGWEAGRGVSFGDDAALPTEMKSGNRGMLRRQMELAPQTSGTAVWLSGFVRHGEDAARALADLQAHGSSALLRTVRAEWAARLDVLAVTTPEDTLNVLINRILPLQSRWSQEDVLASALLSPGMAKRRLIQRYLQAGSAADWAKLALLTGYYTDVTGDESLWKLALHGEDGTLYARCTKALLAVPLDRNHLPEEENRAQSCFLYAMAARTLDAHQENEDLSAMRRKLLGAADLHLWRDGYYGDTLTLDVQCLAALAIGDLPRTRQAMQTVWEVLYDRPHGLVRQRMPEEDNPVLPGLPGNGGMNTKDTALYLWALLKTGMNDKAQELLAALNPLHHTDEPQRQAVFTGAPYLLHGGMQAEPLTPGRAVAAYGEDAAGLLYAAVMLGMLGFRRSGGTVRISPSVPEDWEEYTITLREGASTWRISMEKRADALTIDGNRAEKILIYDDGRIHRVHVPLK